MNTEHFKKKLEAELKTITADLESVGKLRNPDTGDWEARETETDEATPMADPNEAADAQEDFTTNRGINDQLEVRYNEIRHALEKIERGTYGVCESCGAQIEEDRLEANP